MLVFIFGISYYIKALNYTTNLDIGESKIEQGGEITIPIKISELPTKGINSFNFGIKYPVNNLELKSITTGKSMKCKEDFSYNEVWNGVVFCLFSDLTQGENQITDEGDLMYLNFQVKENSSLGDASIEFYEDDKRKITVGTLDLEKVDLKLTSGKINIIQLEDINEDGVVDILDIAQVSSLYNTQSNEPRYMSRADLNKDNIIDIYDIVKVSKKVGM